MSLVKVWPLLGHLEDCGNTANLHRLKCLLAGKIVLITPQSTFSQNTYPKVYFTGEDLFYLDSPVNVYHLTTYN